jgi:signal transduction histidine kinase
VDLVDTVKQSADFLVSLARSRDISFELPDGVLNVEADRSRLQQVITNLLANAINFSPKGGAILLDIATTGGSATVSISDEGPGIPEKDKEKIFDRFEQVDISDRKVKGGSGLGLAICKNIVQLHGGQIGVSARNDNKSGSTFWFTIPTVKAI